MWKIIEEDGSWNDVADRVFPLLEDYCNKVNKNKPGSPIKRYDACLPNRNE